MVGSMIAFSTRLTIRAILDGLCSLPQKSSYLLQKDSEKVTKPKEFVGKGQAA